MFVNKKVKNENAIKVNSLIDNYLFDLFIC